jgi:hypothetical protein
MLDFIEGLVCLHIPRVMGVKFGRAFIFAVSGCYSSFNTLDNCDVFVTMCHKLKQLMPVSHNDQRQTKAPCFEDETLCLLCQDVQVQNGFKLFYMFESLLS